MSDDGQADETAARKLKLANLRSKINQGRVINKAAAMDEYRRKTEGEAAVEAKRKKDAWLERKRQHDKDVKEGLAVAGNSDMGVTAQQAEERAKKKRKKAGNAAACGWDMFNVDTQIKTYNKRIDKVHETFGDTLQAKYKEDTEDYAANPEKLEDLEYCIVSEPTDEMRMRLKTELAVTQARRGQFSRRRAFDEEAGCDYIDDRNMKFNQKIKRHFDSHTTEIRQNLERGTAL